MTEMLRLRSLSAASLFALAALSRAGTFYDDFSSGLNASLYTVTSDSNATYAPVNATQGNVQLAKLAGGNGASTGEAVTLPTSKIGGPFTGDFSASIDLSNAMASGSGINQIEFHANFADGSIFFDSFSDDDGTGVGTGSNYTAHVYDGSVHTYYPVMGNAGTFTITRVGAVVSGYFGGQLLYSEMNTAALSSLAFTVESYTGTDPVSATYDNLYVTAPQATPEPSALAAFGLGAAAVLRRRKRA